MSDQQQYKYMTVDDIKGLDDEQKHLNTSAKDQPDNSNYKNKSLIYRQHISLKFSQTQHRPP